MSPAFVPVGGELGLNNTLTGCVELSSAFVAKLIQSGTSTSYHWIWPGPSKLVTAATGASTMGKGTDLAKVRANCQLSSMGSGLVAPARLSQISRVHLPNAFLPAN